MERDNAEIKAHLGIQVHQARRDGLETQVTPVVKVRKVVLVPLVSLVPQDQPVSLAPADLLDRRAQLDLPDLLDHLVSLHAAFCTCVETHPDSSHKRKCAIFGRVFENMLKIFVENLRKKHGRRVEDLR